MPRSKQTSKQARGLKLNRLQAINLLKEIYDKILDLDPQTVDLIESKSDNPLSPSYSVRFTGLGHGCIEQIMDLVERQGLIVKVKEDEVIICV